MSDSQELNRRDALAAFSAAGLTSLLSLGALGLQPSAEARARETLRVDPNFRFATAPAMDLPLELRTSNWGGGSCVHASTVSLLRWQGQHEMADWWRKTYIGGEYSGRLIARMDAAGLRFAYTLDGEEAFLEYCIRTRRGAGIFYKPSHAINLVGLDDDNALLLDNNYVNRYEPVPRERFMQNWKYNYGGFAWTLVYIPPPPQPFWS